jgi:crotonobetaine/carnitine-CoA ligase
MMMALLAGSPIAVVERFSASRFWDDVRAFGATQAMGVFDMIPILLNRPPSPDDRHHPLRRFYMGKSVLDAPLFDRFGVHAVETYTSTEVGIGTASPFGEWRMGSCGVTNSERHEVTIVDEVDREVGPGEPGEIVLRPKQPCVITTGYYNYPQVTAETFRNLWFHTGDRAYRDADGYFYFVDRIKDAIRRGGENISAFELEQSVNAHPAVLESAAFGVPSELEEEEVKVAVVVQPHADLDPAELAAYCRDRLPRFMVPRYIEFVDELPRTGTGKIAKHVLRKEGDGGITHRTWDSKR